MIRWNKWTRDYTYTYEWHDGVWRLIHKKSNRPVVHWIKSWYTKPVKLTEYGQRQDANSRNKYSMRHGSYICKSSNF